MLIETNIKPFVYQKILLMVVLLLSKQSPDANLSCDLSEWSAEEAQKLPIYLVMDLDSLPVSLDFIFLILTLLFFPLAAKVVPYLPDARRPPRHSIEIGAFSPPPSPLYSPIPTICISPSPDLLTVPRPNIATRPALISAASAGVVALKPVRPTHGKRKSVSFSLSSMDEIEKSEERTKRPPTPFIDPGDPSPEVSPAASPLPEAMYHNLECVDTMGVKKEWLMP